MDASRRPDETLEQYTERILALLAEANRRTEEERRRTEEVSRLKEEVSRLKEEERRRTEEVSRLKEEERRMKEEERRRTEEVRRLKEEERRMKEEAYHARLQADLDTKRAIEKHQQTVRYNQSLLEELQHQRDKTDAQSLPAYLAQVSRLQRHAFRLLPQPFRRPLQEEEEEQQQQQPSVPQQRHAHIPVHVQRSSAMSSRGATAASTSTQPTTKGVTDIEKKYYPLRLRPWHEFEDEVQHGMFARIHGTLTQQHPAERGLPSRARVQIMEDDLLESLPLAALHQDGALNASRTTSFLKAVLLTPASHILNEYLKTTAAGDDHTRPQPKIFFDTDVESVMAVQAGSQSSAGSAAATASADGPGNTEGINNTRVTSDASNSRPKKVMPDCLVLCMAADTMPNSEVQLLACAEHKPLHALRAESVSVILQGLLAEDQLVRLARETLARRRTAQAKKLQAASSSAQANQQQAANSRQASASGATSKTQRVNKLGYLSYALAQAYHYMLTSGIEFGFLTSGEVLVFLRIPEDDATILYYHASFFPVSSRAPTDGDANNNNSSRSNSRPAGLQLPQNLTHAPYPAPGDPVSEEELAKLPVAQMASFCEYARPSQRRSTAWVVAQFGKLAQFPELPPGAAQDIQMPSLQLGKRRRDADGGDGGNDGDDADDADDADDGDNGDDGDDGPGDQAMDQDISATFLSTTYDLQARPRPSCKVEPPALPYCTNSCLLGLVQSGPLDPKCPNVSHHQAAATKSALGRHPLTLFDLTRRIRDQLYDTPEVNCAYSRSHRGAIGYPFKLVLTGFGYTLVGKAVREEHRGRLLRESKIYQGLRPLQGVAIPVHLGLIRLHVGYPLLSEFVQLPYMMLLSYAGDSMLDSLVEEDDDLDEQEKMKNQTVVHDRAEAARTMQELQRWGLEDQDDNVSNFRWCPETGRAMRIDFDRAYLLASVAPVPDQQHPQHDRQPLRLFTNHTNQIGTSASSAVSPASQDSKVSAEQRSVSSHNTPATPTHGLDDAAPPCVPLADDGKAQRADDGSPLKKCRRL